MRQFLGGGAAFALAVALSSPAAAQDTTSAIRGTVTANGAPVAGATVTVTHVPSGTRNVSTTDASGTFSATGIRTGGPYSVAVSAPGYADQQVTDIQAVASQAFELPVELQPVGKDIVVTAARVGNARLIAPGPTTVLTTRQIANIATVNRDIRDLERRDPFARLDDTPSGGRAVSFAGQNARFNRFSVDGVPITDNFGLNQDGLPSRRSPIPLDAIGQFQAKVAPYDVREGNFQGGAINIILRSGTNTFQGTGFYAYQGDGLTGDRTKGYAGNPSGRIDIPKYHTDNYGAELSGPIIKDRVFFMVAGERLRGGFPIQEGPVDNNAGVPIQNLTQAQVDRVSQIASARYGYDTGGVLRSSGDKDDRVVGKIDANITDEQRLSLTGTYAKDSLNIVSNAFTTSPTGLGLESNGYVQGNQLYTGVAQLNSKWSDSFSTEARGFYKHYKRIQDPIDGRGFAQMQVCTAETSDRLVNGVVNPNASASTQCASGASTVSFGPDISRQTNELTTETWGGLLQARLTLDNHDLRVFGEYQRTKVFNSFLQRSSGDYYFDSIADFQAGNAQRFRYGNAVPSLVPEDAAARFRYQTYVFGVQDTWRLADNLTFNYGARYDLYGGHSEAAFAQPFFNRYGFANNAFLNGRGILQPRLALDYKPLPRVQLRAGGGIFSGGAPDVYVANSFSNTGVLSNSIDVRQENNGISYTGTGFTNATGAQVLTNVNGATIPGAANAVLTNATVSSTSTTNALDPNFKIPSQWRATVSADYRANLGPLGDDWNFGADFLYSGVRNQVLFTDIRSVPIPGSLTPDGRQRYRAVTSFNDTNSDIFLTNTNKGRSLIAVARFDKTWDFGLNLNGSFTYQDVKDQAPATSSTAGSNYSNGAFLDPNIVQYGRSNDEVRYFFKYAATFDHAFFGDYKTTVALFGETRIGRPYSFTMQDNSNARSPVFGTIGTNSRYLLYVPNFGGDSRVSYGSNLQQTQIEDYFRRMGLGKYQGRATKRNSENSPWFTRLDLHLSQEVPTGFGRSRLTAFADIENFTNLINRKWGQIREYAFPYNVSAVRVSCLVAPVANGAAGTPTTTSSQACAQYRYTPAATDANGNFLDPNQTVYGRQSLFVVRVGARFTF